MHTTPVLVLDLNCSRLTNSIDILFSISYPTPFKGHYRSTSTPAWLHITAFPFQHLCGGGTSRSTAGLQGGSIMLISLTALALSAAYTESEMETVMGFSKVARALLPEAIPTTLATGCDRLHSDADGSHFRALAHAIHQKFERPKDWGHKSFCTNGRRTDICSCRARGVSMQFR